MLTETKIKAIKALRYAKKYFDGGGLYLLVTPTGARCWRYRYRFAGKDKTLALGTFEFVDLARARIRHQFARRLLAKGIDPGGLESREQAGIRVEGAGLGDGAGKHMGAPSIFGEIDQSYATANQCGC